MVNGVWSLKLERDRNVRPKVRGFDVVGIGCIFVDVSERSVRLRFGVFLLGLKGQLYWSYREKFLIFIVRVIDFNKKRSVVGRGSGNERGRQTGRR